MYRYLTTALSLALSLAAAWAGEAAPAASRPSSYVSYPYLKPDERPRKAREALDPATKPKARFDAVWGLAVSGYCPESAEALGTVAADAKCDVTTRAYAAMGLSNFTNAMPAETRKALQDKLYGALEAEKEKLNDGVMRTLIGWGDADRVARVLGERLRGHPVEVAVLKGISSADAAVARLWEMYKSAPAVTGQAGWTARWYVGAALIHRKDKRGIDILLECLTVKEPWPIENPSPEAKESSAASFRQSLHGTFDWIARTLDERFGYEAGGTWTPQLAEAIPRMVEWWQAHRDTWSFDEAMSNVVPAIQPGKPLTKRQARVLAAKLANDAFAKQAFQHAGGKPVGKIETTPERFNDVKQKDGRWILRMVVSRGPEAFVDFAADGSDEKVVVNYAWR